MHEFIGSSPLSFVGGEAQQQSTVNSQQQQYTAPTIEQLAESNAERNYRDAANFCEVVAPAALGSAVVFAFHSMQVAGGSIVAIAIYQVYLAAKLTGQSSGRWTSAIVGAGVIGSMIFALGEPMAELQQASEVKDRIGTAIKEFQITRKIDAGYFDYLPSIALAIIVFCLLLKFKGVRQCR
jgi:hypothetical protein